MVDTVTVPRAIAHATRGVRVGGLIVGLFHSTLAATTYFTQSDKFPAWMSCMWLLVGAFVAIRPWWLSIVIVEDGFIVTSWFRRYQFRRGEVESIDMRKVHSMGLGAIAVGYIPFVGSVRMIEIVRNGGRQVWLPCLLGRRNDALRLARALRVQVGLSSAHSLLND